jgi:hypothetical protein
MDITDEQLSRLRQKVSYLIERGYVEESQYEETLQKMIAEELKSINSNVGHDAPTSTDSRQP